MVLFQNRKYVLELKKSTFQEYGTGDNTFTQMEDLCRKIADSRIILALLLGMLVLSACLNSNASPTPDINMIYTQAAQTLAFQLTGTAAALPTATFTPAPTNTTAPTATLAQTLPPLGTVNPVITLPGFATATLSAPKAPDAALWVDQSPADGTVMGGGNTFDIAWRLKNTGTTTWTTNYTYRYFSGAKLHENINTYKLKAPVKPNEEVVLFVDAVAPYTSGEYVTNWVITNEAGTNFYNFNLTIKVGASSPTATIDLDDILLRIRCS